MTIQYRFMTIQIQFVNAGSHLDYLGVAMAAEGLTFETAMLLQLSCNYELSCNLDIEWRP